MKFIGLVVITFSMLQMSCGSKNQKAASLASKDLSSEQLALRESESFIEANSRQSDSLSKESESALASFVGTWSGKIAENAICLYGANDKVIQGSYNDTGFQLNITNSLDKLTVTHNWADTDGSGPTVRTLVYEISPDGQVTLNQRKSGRLFTGIDSYRLAFASLRTNESDQRFVGAKGWIYSYKVPYETPNSLIFEILQPSVGFYEGAQSNCARKIFGVLTKSRI